MVKPPYGLPEDNRGEDPLAPLTEAGLAHGNVQAILPEVLDRIRDDFAADSAGLMLADAAGSTLEVAAAVGALERELTLGIRIPVGAGVIGRIAAERRPLALDSLAGHPVVSPVMREVVKSLLGVPLVVEGRLLGVLHVGSRSLRRFTGREVRRLQDIADRMALALDHARLLQAELASRDEAVRAERVLRTTEKLAATGRLAASIAHEINNPMASVTNLLYLLQHHETLDATAAEYVRLAQEELQRVTHIVRQMLGFYRESEAPVAVNLRDVVENVLLLYGRRLQNARIQVDTRFRADASIQGFPGEIRQVFSNLIVNSLEALGENGHLRIDARRSRDWSNPSVVGVRVLIGDNGPGIPEAARRHICEPFFTTKGERGTGLGLWVSEGIVRKHGGAMRVRSSTSERRHGTCFSVFFPLEPSALKRAA